jgi:hypothetical protein
LDKITLCEIANLPSITDPEQVKDLFNQALAIAESTQDDFERCKIYCLIIQALAKYP